MYDLMAPSTAGEPVPAKKPTTWMSNPAAMIRRLSKTCNNQHSHQPLMGGRAKDAELYPKKLIWEIVRGMRDQLDEDLLKEEEERSQRSGKQP